MSRAWKVRKAFEQKAASIGDKCFVATRAGILAQGFYWKRLMAGQEPMFSPLTLLTAIAMDLGRPDIPLLRLHLLKSYLAFREAGNTSAVRLSLHQILWMEADLWWLLEYKLIEVL
jgi:hypothetical protein